MARNSEKVGRDGFRLTREPEASALPYIIRER